MIMEIQLTGFCGDISPITPNTTAMIPIQIGCQKNPIIARIIPMIPSHNPAVPDIVEFGSLLAILNIPLSNKLSVLNFCIRLHSYHSLVPDHRPLKFSFYFLYIFTLSTLALGFQKKRTQFRTFQTFFISVTFL